MFTQRRIAPGFKGTLAWDFLFLVVWSNEPLWALDKCPKIFLILVSNSSRSSIIRAFCIFWVFAQNSFLYSQYTHRLILCILSTRTDSFCVFSENTQRKLVWRFNSLLVSSIYIHIHSAYSQYKNRFIPHILSIPTDSFRVFCKCAQIILNIRKRIIFFTAFKVALFQKTIWMCSPRPKTHKE